MSSSWFRDGLRFECTQCGDCCTGRPGYVWVNRREIERLAEFLHLSVAEFGRRYLRRVQGSYSLIEKANGDCIFYRDGCTVYPERPGQCRSFPFWPENLESREAWQEVAAECPGIGSARLYPVEDIRHIRDGKGEASGTPEEP